MTTCARWIKTRLVSNPTCLLASSVDVFLIVDTKMRYSVLGGPPEIIEKFEKRFGGAEALQQTFTNYVDQMRMGVGHRRREVGAGLPAEVVRLDC